MIDWDRFRGALRRGNEQLNHLGRLRTMEAWLELPADQALTALGEALKRARAPHAGGAIQGREPPSYDALCSVLRLKLQRDGHLAPAADAQLPRRLEVLSQLQSAAREGAGTATVVARPASGLREATSAIYPRLDRIARSFVPEKPASSYDVEELEKIVADYGTLEAHADPGDPALSDLRWFKGNATFVLARTLVQLGQLDAARDAFENAARLFESAHDVRNAADCRARAADLGRRQAAGLDGALEASLRALTSSPLRTPSSPAAAATDLSRANALADLIGSDTAAGDVFEAARSAAAAAEELADLGFTDPLANPREDPGTTTLAGDVAAAVDAWIVVSSASAAGLEFAECLLKVARFYCAILSARVSMWIQPDQDPSRQAKLVANAEVADRLLRELQDLTDEMMAKWTESNAEVLRDLSVYYPAMTEGAASNDGPTPAAAAGPSWLKRLRVFDDALLEVRQKCNARLETHEPMDDLLQVADGCRQQAAGLGMPLYEAKALLARAYVTGHLGLGPETRAAAVAARAALLGDRATTLASLTQSFERVLYLETCAREMLAYQIAGDHEKVLALCQDTVRDFEAQRSRVNSPFQEGPFLFAALPFYRMGGFAAFKLQRWDTMLDLLELVKARSSVRNRLARAATEPSPDQWPDDVRSLEASFKGTSDELAGLLRDAPHQQSEKTKAIATRRRWLWDTLAIARHRSSARAPLPELSLAGLQATLGPDEAAIGYYWLNDSIILVVLCDHDRLHVERVFLEPADQDRLSDLVDAVQGVTENMDEEVQRLGAVLFPAFCRDFVAAKQRLILSPNQSLHVFPFHAVTWDHDAFLGTRFALRYVPNFSSLLIPWQSRCEDRVLAIAVRQCDIPPFTELANVEAEVDELRAFYDARGIPVNVLKGEDACRETLERMSAEGELARYRWVHLGTHGESALASPDDPLESRLLLRRSQIDSMDLAGMGIEAEVVVLSACHTGQRAVRGRGLAELPGDEIFGLQSALFQSGVRAVLATLWPVQIEAASAIVPVFHRGLAAGDPPDMALRAAITQYLAEVEPKYRKIFYWAPFFISSLGATPPKPDKLEGRQIMPKLTLHFETSPGADLDALSSEIARTLRAVPQVETAEAELLRTQGVVEIIAAIGFATKIIATSTLFLSAVSELVKAWKELRARFPDLPAPKVEIGLRQIPIDQITAKDAEKAVRA